MGAETIQDPTHLLTGLPQADPGPVIATTRWSSRELGRGLRSQPSSCSKQLAPTFDSSIAIMVRTPRHHCDGSSKLSRQPHQIRDYECERTAQGLVLVSI